MDLYTSLMVTGKRKINEIQKMRLKGKTSGTAVSGMDE